MRIIELSDDEMETTELSEEEECEAWKSIGKPLADDDYDSILREPRQCLRLG